MNADIDMMSIELLYKKYSGILYNIALQISPSEMDAEKLIVETFREILKQDIKDIQTNFSCIELINLITSKARKEFNTNLDTTKFKLKQFENLPILHCIICEQISLEDYSKRNKLTKQQTNYNLRGEFLSIRKLTLKQ